MNAILAKFRVTLIAGFISLGAVSSSVFALDDVLVTPAVESVMASKSLLLDITRAGERLVTVGARGHILLSDDEGLSWRQASVPVSVLLTAVSFSDERNGWAVGHGGIVLHSKDGGETWEKQFDGNQANEMTIAQAEKEVAELELKLDSVADESAEDLAYEIEDAQFALEDAELDAEIGASKPFLDVLFYNKNEGFAVGAYGFIFKTINGGKVWQNYGSRLDNPDHLHLNAIAQINGGVLLIGGEAGLLFRSSDNGETWGSITSPYEGSFFGISGTGERGAAIAFGLRGNMFRSEDDGISWNSVDSGTESTLMAASYGESGRISVVGNSGSVLLSEDGGRTFSETIRNDRLGNVSVVFIKGPHLVMVGESGVSRASLTGQNL